MTLGEKIKDRRGWLGIPRRVLAERIGKTVNTVASWEAGRSTPPRDIIGPLCNALNVPADYFDNVLPPVTSKDVGADCLLYDAAEEIRSLAECRQSSCTACGWHTQEHARREALLREQGLTRLDNGLKGLKIEAEGGAVR